jgi:hypothetical protein
MNAKRIRELTFELNQLRIEQMFEAQAHDERMKEILQEIEHLTINESVEVEP